MTSEVFACFVADALGQLQATDESTGDALPTAVGHALGCVLFKSLVDARAVHWSAPKLLFRLCLEDPPFGAWRPTMRQLWAAVEVLDPELTRGLRSLVDLADAAVCALAFDDGTHVTNDNRQEFVAQRLWQGLHGRRAASLRSVREGFQSCLNAVPSSLFRRMAASPRTVWESAVSTDADSDTLVLAGRDVVQRLEFRGWGAEDSTPYFLCCWLHAACDAELRDFLRLVTGMRGLCPANSRKLLVQRADRFAAQTCFWLLHLPPCGSLSDLRGRVSVALLAMASDPAMHEDPNADPQPSFLE